MSALLVNLVLALVWVFLTGSFTPANLLTGYLVGFGILAFFSPVSGSRGYVRKGLQFVSLLLYFFYNLVAASVMVSIEILRPRFIMMPSILAVPLRARTDLEMTLLANLVTLTPGTLSVDIDERSHVLFIHFMYSLDPDRARQGVADLEWRLLEVMR